MNIIFLVIDTLRYDYVGLNGNDLVETPNLDRFAAEAWRFERVFCASYPTIPYRTDVLTGRYGAPFHAWQPLSFDLPTLPRVLAEAGYATQLIHDTPHLVNGGHNFDWPFHSWTFVRGAEVDRAWIAGQMTWSENWKRDPLFEVLGEEPTELPHLKTYAHTNYGRRKPEDWNCAKLFETAAQFLRDNAKRRNFFLWLDCFDPHEPWDTPPEFMRRFDSRPNSDGRIDPRSLFHHRNDKRLSKEARAHLKAQYVAKVSWMDYCLGQLLDALAATGLDRETAVIITGDHGTNVGERGRFGKGFPVREQEGHVPLFIRTPEGDSGDSHIIVQPQDFFATILGLIGQKPTLQIDSHDILTLARDGQSGPREIALAGSVATRWRDLQTDPKATLFTAFTREWALEVTLDPEEARLTRLGSLETVEQDYPDIAAGLYRAALNEVARRGTDAALMAWLRNSGRRPFPKECRFSDRVPPPKGFTQYFNRTYTGE